MALDVYPRVTLAGARKARKSAKGSNADGRDHGAVGKADKLRKGIASGNVQGGWR